jgi:predicted RNA-binding protein
MTKYWLCVTNEDNWNIVKTKLVWGVPEKRGKCQIQKVKPSDKLVFYVTPKRIGGIFEATSETYESNEKIFSWADFGKEELFPNRVHLKPIVVVEQPIIADQLVKKMSFCRGQRCWSIFLRRAMLEITKSDFNLVFQILFK